MKTRRPALCAAVVLLLTASARGEEPRTIADAAAANDIAAVRAALRNKSAIDKPDVFGNTALSWAVQHDNQAMMADLLAAGASPAQPNRYGVAPLSIACANGSFNAVKRLLEAGADPNTAQAEGETALMTAARSGSVDAVRLLIARGAQVSAAESWRDQTALMWAAAEGHTAVVEELLRHGAALDARSKDAAGTPRRRRPGAQESGPRGFTALLFAVRGGHIGAARALLDAGASIDEKTAQGNNLLHLAIMNAHYELAAMLLERGADPNAVSAERLSPLHHVVQTRRPGWQTLPPPVPSGRLDGLELMRRLIARGADVNSRLGPLKGPQPPSDDEQLPPPAEGATPLWLAAIGPDVEAMQLLLGAGADPSIASATQTTTLIAAAGIEYRQGYRQKLEPEVLQAVKLLLDRGLAVNAADDAGNTPLHGAAMRGVNTVVSLLVERGADLNALNRDGKRPLEMAEDASDARAQPETAALLRRLMATSPRNRQR